MSSNITLSSTLTSSTLSNLVTQSSTSVDTSATPLVQDPSTAAETQFTQDECVYYVNGLSSQKTLYSFLALSLIANFTIFLWWFRLYYYKRRQRRRELRKAFEEYLEAEEAEEARGAEEAARAAQAEIERREYDLSSGAESFMERKAAARPVRPRERPVVDAEGDIDTTPSQPPTKAAMRRQMRQKVAEVKATPSDDELVEKMAYEKPVYKLAPKSNDTAL